MKKQKSTLLKQCFCKEFRQSESKIKNELMKKMKCQVDESRYSVSRLLHMYFEDVAIKQKLLNCIDSKLRTFFKQSPTIEYEPKDGILEMIQKLVQKVQKQRGVHYYSGKKEEKLLNKFTEQIQMAEEQIAYLKELLKEEQIESEGWKDQAIILQRQLNSIKYKDGQLQTIKKEHLEEIDKLKKTIKSLKSDKDQISKKYFQKTSQVTRLAQELKTTKISLKYSAKMEILEQIQNLSEKEDSKHHPTKAQMVEYLQSSGKAGTPFKIIKSSSYQSLSQGSPIQKHLVKYQSAQKLSLFNRSISTNPEESRMLSFERSHFDIHRKTPIAHLFSGQVLQNEDEKRYFLVNMLQEFKNNMIQRTKLLYRWDRFNQTNIHKYIDGKNNIVLLIKTSRDWCLGAYSQAAFKQKSFSNQPGLLISLSDQLFFKNIKKAIIYDESDVIFGNYDLRVKAGNNNVTSNFGAIGCFYDHKGSTVHTLLGQQKGREANIKEMEIFELIFEE